MDQIEIVLAVLCGAAGPIQSSLNAGLVGPLDSTAAAALISFSGGCLTLLLICPFNLSTPYKPPNDTPEEAALSTLQRFRRTPLFLFLLPAFIALFYVFLGTIVGRKLGFSLFFVCLVAGQLFSSTVIDHFGLFGIKQNRMTIYRAISVCIVAVGSVLSVAERIASTNVDTGHLIAFLCLSFIAGGLATVHPVMNAKVVRQLRVQAHRIALLTYSIGLCMAALVFPFLVLPIGKKPLDGFNRDGFEAISWYQYFGGFFGASFVCGSIILAPKIGVAIFFVCMIAGQLFSALLIDSLGWFHSPQITPTPMRLCGVIMVFLAVMAFRFEARIQAWRKRGAKMDITELIEEPKEDENIIEITPIGLEVEDSLAIQDDPSPASSPEINETEKNVSLV